MRAERVGERAWIVVDLSHRLHDNAGDGFRVLAIVEEVGRDSGGSRDRKSPQFYPFAGLQSSDVQPHIGPAGLTSLRKREVMLIGGEVADSVEGGCRSVRDGSISDCAFPSGHLGSELQPSGTKI